MTHEVETDIEQMTAEQIEAAIADVIEKNFDDESSDISGEVEKSKEVSLDELCASFSPTDTGAAERLEARFGDLLRFIPAKREGGAWIAYTGKHWERESLSALDLVKKTMKMIPRELRHKPKIRDGEDEQSHKKRVSSWTRDRLKFAEKSLSARAMSDALRVARIDMRASELDFDNKPNLFNTPNGTIDLDTGFWCPNRPEDMLTGISRAASRIVSKCELWVQFIKDICRDADGNEDLEKEHYLQVILGYSLRGRNPEHLIFFFTGDETDESRNGRNGKSLLMEIIRYVLGDDYCGEFEREMIIRFNGRDPEAKHRHCLLGKRVSFSPEYKKDDMICSATLKRLVGEPRFHGRYLGNDPFEANMTATLFVVSNCVPQMSSNEMVAVWGKVRRVRFLNRFWDGFGKEPDRFYQMIDLTLEARLKEEADGILGWLIEGAKMYAESGIPDYADARTSLQENVMDGDTTQEFINACVVREDGYLIDAKDAYTAYLNFCVKNAIEPKNVTSFGREITAKNIPVIKKNGARFRVGVRLSVVGQALLNNQDPQEAVKFKAREVGPNAAKSDWDFIDEDRKVVEIDTSKLRVIRGDRMSDDDLKAVRSGDVGSRFTHEGVMFEIVEAGPKVQLDSENVIPFKKSGFSRR